MSLHDYYSLYETCANRVKDWRDKDKNQLCFDYIKNENDSYLSEGYLSAIICKYWNKIDKTKKVSGIAVSYYDCYRWLVDAIVYVLQKRKWEDPSSDLFQDPKAPDKAINICLKTSRLTFLQQANRYNRKINNGIISIDEIMENNPSNTVVDICTNDSTDYIYEAYLLECFKNKKYFSAFMIDAILNLNVFEEENIDGNYYVFFSEKKLLKHMRSLDKSYCSIFALRYKLPVDKVINASKYCTMLSTNTMHSRVDDELKILFRKFFYDKDD